MNKLIGLSGKKRSGKDTLAKLLQVNMDDVFESKSFAYNLRKVCQVITGLPDEYFFDDQYKGHYLDTWGVTIRQMLQRVGTEGLRDNFDSNIWVKSLFSTYNPNSKWIITDVRFKDELQYVKDKGGIIIRVDASYDGYVNPMDQHQSEVDLDNSYDEFDYVIYNSGDISDLDRKVKSLVSKWKE